MKKSVVLLLGVLFAILQIIIVLNHLTTNQNFYDREFQKLNTYNKIPECLNETNTITRYLSGKNKIQTLNKEKYTEDEILHLKDVKKLIDLSKLILFFGTLIFILTIILNTIYKKEKLLLTLKKISKISFFTIIIISISGLIFSICDFNLFFQKFHYLFFPQGNFIFPTNSLLIRLFPQEFFKNAFTTLISRTIILSLAIYGIFYALHLKGTVSKISKLKTKRKSKEGKSKKN